MENIELHVVIARYNENIAWVFDALQNIKNVKYFVYNKGHDEFDLIKSIKDGANVQVIKLPNLGRESDTYMHHIIANYEEYKSNPNAYVFFTQGDIAIHTCSRKPLREYVEDLIKDAVNLQISKSNANPARLNPSYLAPYNFKMKKYGPVPVKAYKDVYGKWFEEFVAPEFPKPAASTWWIAAIFCVQSALIVKKPLTYFQALHSTVNDDPNPETGHYFERAWYYIMT